MKVANGIFMVKIPLPFQLDFVNCYLLEDVNGWFLVDAGINYKAGRDAWVGALNNLGLEFPDIKKILVTHFHPDHYGASGWLQECSKAKVYMSNIDLEMAKAVWKESVNKTASNREHMIKYGVPQELAKKIEAVMSAGINWVKPEPSVHTLREGDTLYIGNELWEVLITPGHSEGHICLYNPNRKIIISGDQLLQDITSNISFLPGSSQNPLKDYLGSLSRLNTLDIDLLLPAHGEIFNNAGQRISGLFKHHRDRLEIVYNAVGRGKTAFEVSQEVFGKGLTLQDQRFALGETIAHLKYLVKEGKLREQYTEDLILYFH